VCSHLCESRSREFLDEHHLSEEEYGFFEKNPRPAQPIPASETQDPVIIVEDVSESVPNLTTTEVEAPFSTTNQAAVVPSFSPDDFGTHHQRSFVLNLAGAYLFMCGVVRWGLCENKKRTSCVSHHKFTSFPFTESFHLGFVHKHLIAPSFLQLLPSIHPSSAYW